MEKQEIFRVLECVLTEKETAEYGERLAAQEKELEAIKDEETSMKSAIKSRKDQKAKEIKRISEIITNRSEMRSISCEIVYDTPKPMQCTVMRTDTGVEVQVRDMTDEEKQISFDYMLEQNQPEQDAEEK